MRLILLFILIFASSYSHSKSYTLKIEVLNELERPIENITVRVFKKNKLLGEGKTKADGSLEFPNIKSKKINIKFSDQKEVYMSHYEYETNKSKTNIIVEVKLGFMDPNWINEIVDLKVKEMLIQKGITSFSEIPENLDCEETKDYSSESEFFGGTMGMMKYIQGNIEYPQTSIVNNEQGKVYIAFFVNEDGSISDVKVERGVSKSLDQEAARLIRNMPKWIPATCEGYPVKSIARLPIVFTLN